jgi:hypothetical protein
VFRRGVDVDDIRVLVSAEPGKECDSPIIQSLNPSGGVVVPILYWYRDVDTVVVFFVPRRRFFTVPSCFSQLRCQLLNPGLELLTVLHKEVGAVLDGGDESEYDLVQGVTGVGVGGGEGVESGLRGERGLEGDRGGDFFERALGVMNANGSTICKVTGRRRDGDGETFGGETRHLFGDVGGDEVAGEVIERRGCQGG